MKKIYMTPQTETTIINVEHHVLAGSPDAKINSKDVIEESDIASRGGGWFDDDEEENY